MKSLVDQIIGKRPSPVREATSIIPGDAQRLPGAGVAAYSDPTSSSPAAAPANNSEDSYLPTALALVAPDTTPKASYPLNPSMVPAPAVPMAQASQGMPPTLGTPAPGGFLPRANDEIADPALATIVGESLASMTPAAVKSAVGASTAAAAAMVPGTEMPPPVVGDATKVCDAFRRFSR